MLTGSDVSSVVVVREHEEMRDAGTVAELHPDPEAEAERSLPWCLTEPTPVTHFLQQGYNFLILPNRSTP